ncbi:uncharacterized protein PHALS_03191 [Plasmopara halstedii]|uniref:Uncharacterized protein n=1 Tax=Plasmopara halstedii TaxID=4781 RepID=A0A0P1AZJ4_PLAHL|nr:uncharacterized protein PHALS_03191 [Plasmopara halstedii]CEG46590.1 hypothetical protein PHALS_03191 [Plasmopara halstedii]|eukprot:XP_024582959.1 hypothetical protein PHALS_03191 [Plasmopara halstedii]
MFGFVNAFRRSTFDGQLTNDTLYANIFQHVNQLEKTKSMCRIASSAITTDEDHMEDKRQIRFEYCIDRAFIHSIVTQSVAAVIPTFKQLTKKEIR